MSAFCITLGRLLTETLDFSAVKLHSFSDKHKLQREGFPVSRVCSFDNGPFGRVTGAIILLVLDVFGEDSAI